MGSIHSSSVMRKSNVRSKLNFSTILLVFFGFLIGISFATVIFTKSFRVKHLKIEISQHYLFPTTRLSSSIDAGIITGDKSYRTIHDLISASLSDIKYSHALGSDGRSKLASFDWMKRYLPISTKQGIQTLILKIHVATNPRGAESLTPGIVVSETDFYLHRLWGDPNEDLKTRPKYLVTFAVGFAQRDNINAAIQKFSDEFTILLFHYDGLTSEWDHFEWSKRAIHVSARGQTKWWYAKRFLHPDIVAAYDYIFIWDEDLGVENFNAEDYLKMVKKHGLEISQPGIEVGPSEKLVQWNITKRRVNSEVHKEERDPQCIDPHLPPCAAFVEIMAPVFSRNAWRCVWHMIQNDLVHGWGLDFALRRCVEPAHEKIGVVDSQWVVHQAVPSLRNQGKAGKGKTRWQGVSKRCFSEWREFETRLVNSDREYFSEVKG